jgi:hypothetical protein
MAEFKKGDRVVFTKDDSWWEPDGDRVVEMPAGTLGTYLGTGAWREAAPWVRLDTGEHVLAWADRIAPAEDHGTGDGSAGACAVCAGQGVVWEGDDDHFPGQECTACTTAPAPLDPAKVKAGDTVTMRVTPVEKGRKPFTVEGEAYGAPGALMVGGLWVMNDKIATLIAHTPAPEPEWEPGRLVSVRVNGRELPGERYQGFVTHHGTVMVANEDGSPESINLAHLRDVRPLVVIDPAEVDVEALTTVGDEAYLTDQSEFRRDGIQAAVLAALAHLGIEVPR